MVIWRWNINNVLSFHWSHKVLCQLLINKNKMCRINEKLYSYYNWIRLQNNNNKSLFELFSPKWRLFLYSGGSLPGPWWRYISVGPSSTGPNLSWVDVVVPGTYYSFFFFPFHSFGCACFSESNYKTCCFNLPIWSV